MDRKGFGFRILDFGFLICIEVVTDYAEQRRRLGTVSTGNTISVNLRETSAVLHQQSRKKNFSQITADLPETQSAQICVKQRLSCISNPGRRISRRSPQKSNADHRRSIRNIISVNLRETSAILHQQSGKRISRRSSQISNADHRRSTGNTISVNLREKSA